MQDATAASLATLMPNTGDTTTLYDSRDEQAYTVAKLADGKYWMTKNLNLAGGTALSTDDTDVTSAYINSFTTGNNLTKTGDTIVLPASSTVGFDTNNYSYVYNSYSTTCGENSPCYSYYSWDATTLGSGRAITTDNTDAGQSICPKGWKLPNSRATISGNSDYYQFAVAYGMDDSDISQAPSDFYYQAGPGTIPNFLLAGGYGSSAFSVGGKYGFYWSSTAGLNLYEARSFLISMIYVGSTYTVNRSGGLPVRCLFNDTN